MTTSCSQDIREGDVVTWREGGKPDPKRPGPEPLGISGCEVKAIATQNGETLAFLYLPRFDEHQWANMKNVYIDD